MAEPAGELPHLVAELPTNPEPATEPVAAPVPEPLVAQPAATNQVTFSFWRFSFVHSIGYPLLDAFRILSPAFWLFGFASFTSTMLRIFSVTPVPGAYLVFHFSPHLLAFVVFRFVVVRFSFLLSTRYSLVRLRDLYFVWVEITFIASLVLVLFGTNAICVYGTVMAPYPI